MLQCDQSIRTHLYEKLLSPKFREQRNSAILKEFRSVGRIIF
jgi:hypothetical protein